LCAKWLDHLQGDRPPRGDLQALAPTSRRPSAATTSFEDPPRCWPTSSGSTFGTTGGDGAAGRLRPPTSTTLEDRASTTATDPNAAINETADRFFEGVLEREPIFATILGDDRFDDRPPTSAEGRAVEARV
jgi:hypothetical protein